MDKTDERVSHKLNHHVFVGSVAVVLVLILTASLPISFCSDLSLSYIYDDTLDVDEFNNLFTVHQYRPTGDIKTTNTKINI